MTAPDMGRVFLDNLPFITGTARKMCSWMVEDIVQETCVRVMASSTYDPSMPAQSWLHFHVMGARNALLRTHYRNHQTGEIQPYGMTPANQEEATDVSTLLAVATRLPSAQREVVEMTLVGMDIGEVGQALGISRQGAHQRLQRARVALKLAA